MKQRSKSSFSRQVVALSLLLLFSSLLGRMVVLTQASSYCPGWPFCIPTAPSGWYKLAHILVIGLAGLLVLNILRNAWGEYRDDRLLLPLTTVMSILFFGQAMTGAILVLRSFPPHLVVLHTFSAVMLWSSLLGLVIVASRSRINHAHRNSDAPHHVVTIGWQRVKDLFMLTKPLIVGLLLLTTVAGLVAGKNGWPELPLFLWTVIGGALAAGGSSALNQYIDRDLDRKMQRTAKRPLAEGRLTPAEGLAFGLALSLASYYIMAGFVNFLAALLSLSGIIYYVIFYSVWLKKATTQNIVIGGGAGAIPPMVGWAAATGHLSLEAWLLFVIVFLWTPPHFWALAIVRRKDYENAGVPMLPVVQGEQTTRQKILLYTCELVAVTMLLPIFKLTGPIYLVAACLLGSGLIYYAWRVWKVGGNKFAWKMYKWSSMYLAFIFLALLVDTVI